MNTNFRNAFLALTAFGVLALSACKTTEDSMDQPAPAADQATPADSSMTAPTPTDSSTTPTDSSTTPTTPTEGTSGTP